MRDNTKTTPSTTNKSELMQLRVDDTASFLKTRGYNNLMREGFYCKRPSTI